MRVLVSILVLLIAFGVVVESTRLKRSGKQLTKSMYIHHPFHNVATLANDPITINAVIEITEGSNIKYEIDEESGLLTLDRILATPVAFPINYGFVPKTIGQDNDPLDVLLISSARINPLTVVPMRVLGIMRMNDTGETDDKVIGVPQKDPSFLRYKQLSDIPVETINKIKAFFQTYKILDYKTVIVQKFEGRLTAYAAIIECQSRYRQFFPK